MTCKGERTGTGGAKEPLREPSAIRLVLMQLPVKNLDILVHCSELSLHMLADSSLILLDLVECYLGL